MVADGGTDPARREARPPNGAIECNITPDGEELSDLPAAALLTHWEVVEVELIQPSATFETGVAPIVLMRHGGHPAASPPA